MPNIARVEVTRPLPRLALVLLLLLGIGLRSQEVVPLLRHIDERDNPRAELRDFRDTVIEPARDLRDGENPYDPGPYTSRHPGHQELDLYGPQLFVVALPFSLLPVSVAQLLWLAVMALSVVVIAWAAWALIGRRADGWTVAGTVGALLATNAVQQGVLTGNIALPLTAAIAAALYWSARKPALAGVLFALVLIKPQLGLPLALLLGFGLQRWRAVGVGLAIAVAAALAPAVAAVRGAGSVSAFIDSISRNLDYSNTVAGDVANRADVLRSDVWGFVGKVANVNPTTATQLLTLIVIAGAASVLLRRSVNPRDNRFSAAALAVFFTALLLSMPHYSYDLALLGVIVLAVGVEVATRSTTLASPIVACGLCCLFPLIHLGTLNRVFDAIGAPAAIRWVDAAAISLGFAFALVALVRAEPPQELNPHFTHVADV